MRLASAAVVAALLPPVVVMSATPARAECVTEIVNAGYGESNYCTDYTGRFRVSLVNGIVEVLIYCNSSIVYRAQLSSPGAFTYNRSACSSRLVLTALKDGGGTTAIGVAGGPA